MDAQLTALVDAIFARDVVAVTQLLAAGADPNAITGRRRPEDAEPDREAPYVEDDFIPLLVLAAETGDANVVRALLAAGARPDAVFRARTFKWQDGHDYHEIGDAFCIAARSDALFDVVELFLQRVWRDGPDATAARARALQEAVEAGAMRNLKLLLEHGVDPGTKTTAPLNAAITAGRLDIVELLVAYGAEFNHAPGGGTVPFHHALKVPRLEIARFLVTQGARAPARGAFERLVEYSGREQVEASLEALGMQVAPPRKRRKKR